MNEFYDTLNNQRPGAKMKTIARNNQKRYYAASQRYLNDGAFECTHCHSTVSIDPEQARVQNRNHCPYCLWSRHMDLYEAGDRLSACRGAMRPVALTLKQSNKKYNRDGQGELMLVHICTECGRPSINRIAADDDVEQILAVFEKSFVLSLHTRAVCWEHSIKLLQAEDAEIVNQQLSGKTLALLEEM